MFSGNYPNEIEWLQIHSKPEPRDYHYIHVHLSHHSILRLVNYPKALLAQLP